MLRLVVPKPLLTYIDNNREGMSRPIYILKCINYIMINNIDLINEGECNDKSGRTLCRGENPNNNRL